MAAKHFVNIDIIALPSHPGLVRVKLRMVITTCKVCCTHLITRGGTQHCISSLVTIIIMIVQSLHELSLGLKSVVQGSEYVLVVISHFARACASTGGTIMHRCAMPLAVASRGQYEVSLAMSRLARQDKTSHDESGPKHLALVSLGRRKIVEKGMVTSPWPYGLEGP